MSCYTNTRYPIDEPNNDEDDTTLVDTLISESVPSPEQLALEQGLRDAVELTLADLTTRETQILSLRYGIGRLLICRLPRSRGNSASPAIG